MSGPLWNWITLGTQIAWEAQDHHSQWRSTATASYRLSDHPFTAWSCRQRSVGISPHPCPRQPVPMTHVGWPTCEDPYGQPATMLLRDRWHTPAIVYIVLSDRGIWLFVSQVSLLGRLWDPLLSHITTYVTACQNNTVTSSKFVKHYVLGVVRFSFEPWSKPEPSQTRPWFGLRFGEVIIFENLF